MKRISLGLLAALLCAAPVASAQDAAVEERLNRLSGQIEDLLAAVAKQDKRLSALEKELDAVREQAAKPTGHYASAEDLRRLAEKLQEIENKRVADNERVIKELEKLARTPGGGSRPPRSAPAPAPEPSRPEGNAGERPRVGFEHVIAPGDTLSTIAQGFREKGVKVTVEQILKANPGLKEKSLKVGQKIFIPGSQS
jgi:uncharacterized protein with von Willebrand factor type A (vWA) domain